MSGTPFWWGFDPAYGRDRSYIGRKDPSELARCPVPDCHAPLELLVGETLILTRCQAHRHIQSVSLAYPAGWWNEP